MDSYYAKYMKKGNMDSIVNDVVSIYGKNRGQDFLADMIQDRERIMDSVIFRLVNTKKNKELLLGMPHDDLEKLGLSMVFYVLLQTGDGQNVTMAITNRLMEIWEVSHTELLEHAKRNTPLKMEYSIRSIQSVLGEYPGIKAGEQNRTDCENMPQMYVLTNSRALYGAGCFIYDGLLEKLADDLGSGFYVLPSSVHEVLLYPSSDKGEAAALKEIVTEINRTELEEEEILIDAVYYYNRETGEQSAA